MATRLYITNSAPSYTPSTVRTTSVSSSSAMVNVALSPTKIGANAAVAQAETSTTNNYRSVLIRGVTEPIYTSGTSGGTLQIMIARLESAAAMNANSLLTVYATVGNSDTVRGTLYSTTVDTVEWPTTQTGVTYTVNLATVALTAGDRIVVEYGYNAANTSGTSYTGTLRYGGTVAADLAANTTGVTTRSPWLEFSAMDSMLSAPKPKTETLVDDFSVDNRATNWPQAYGTTAVSGGVGTVSVAGASAYSGLQTNTDVYTLVESYAKVKMTPAAGIYSALTLTGLPANGTDVSLYWVGGTLTLGIRSAYSHTSSASVALAAGTPIWMGVGEGVAGAAKFGSSGVAGNLYFFTSTDGISWTQRHTVASPSYISSLYVLLEAGEGTGTVTFDDYNVTSVESYSSTLAISSTGTLTASSAAVMANTGSITGSGTLSSNRIANLKGTVSLAGSGSLKGRLTPADITLPTYKEMALEITSTAENSTKDWTTAYRYIEDISDGRGYTAGIVGWTSGPGDMLVLVQYYSSIAPGNILEQYIPELQQITAAPENQWTSLSHSLLDPTFTVDWMSAADNDPLFRKAQRDERDRMYWNPALTEAQTDNVGPLGLAIYYDISVNHGQGNDPESFQGILAQARNEAVPPSLGGDEGIWLTKVTDLRAAVLTTWGDNPPNGRVAAHRTLIASNNFNLVPSYGWSMYGTAYTMPTYPSTPTDGGSSNFTGTSSLSGSGTVTVSGKPAFVNSKNVSGSGTLSVSGKPAYSSSVGLSGSGTITTVNKPGYSNAVGLSGIGSVTLQPVVQFTGSSTFNGSGTLSTVNKPGYANSTGLSGSGAVTSVNAPSYSNVTGLSGSGTVTTANKPGYSPTVNVSGSGTLTAIGIPVYVSSVALSGSGTLSAPAVPKTVVTSLLSGSGTLSSTQGAINLVVPVGLTGTGLQTSVSTVFITISKTFTGIGTLTSASNLGTFGTSSTSGSGTLAVTGNANQTSSAVTNGSGTLSATQTNITQKLDVSFSGTGFTGFQTITGGLAPFNSEGAGELSGEIDSLSITKNVNLTSSGNLTAQPIVAFSKNILFGSSSNLVSNEIPNIEQDSNLTNTGTLSGDVKNISQSETADLHGTGFLGFQTGSSGTSSFSSNSTGDLSVEVFVTFVNNVDLNSSGELILDPGEFAQNTNVFIFGTGTLSGPTKPAFIKTADLDSIGILSIVASAQSSGSTTVGLSGTGTLSANATRVDITDTIELSSVGTLSGLVAPIRDGSISLTGAGTLSVTTVIDRPQPIELITTVFGARQYNGFISENQYRGFISDRKYSTTVSPPIIIIKFNPPKRLNR